MITVEGLKAMPVDEPIGEAVICDIGAILQAEGYTVRYVYPEDSDTVSTLRGCDVQTQQA